MGQILETLNPENLSAVIIETLKDLLASRRPISAAQLQSALAKKEELQNLLLATSSDMSAPPPDSNHRGEDFHREASNCQDQGKLDNGRDPLLQSWLLEIKNFYLRILSEFEEVLGEDYHELVLAVREKMTQAHDFQKVFALNEDIISLLDASINSVAGELTNYNHFISEITRNLLELEKQLNGTFSNAGEAHLVNHGFNDSMARHVIDLKGSLAATNSLAEMKKVVISKLTTIKDGLAKKREWDQLQHQKTAEELSSLKTRVNGMKSEITHFRKQTEALRKEILKDPLTEIHNRRAYEKQIQEEFKRYQRYSQPFSILLVDIDHFKLVNDTYGHRAGDRCLKEVAKLLGATLRETDFLARFGGEEFIILLPGTDTEGLMVPSERLRRVIEKAHFLYRRSEIPVTISIGGTTVTPSDRNGEELFLRADAALYEAKNGGRNRSVILQREVTLQLTEATSRGNAGL